MFPAAAGWGNIVLFLAEVQDFLEDPAWLVRVSMVTNIMLNEMPPVVNIKQRKYDQSIKPRR